MRRCKCTGVYSRGGIWLVGGHHFFSENISSFFISLQIYTVRHNLNGQGPQYVI